jgi:hypothetical protein
VAYGTLGSNASLVFRRSSYARPLGKARLWTTTRHHDPLNDSPPDDSIEQASVVYNFYTERE